MPSTIKTEFLEKTLKLEQKTQSEFFALLEKEDPTQNETFQRAIEFAVKRLDLPPTAIMDEFTVTRGTVSRWINGKSLPHPMMRPVIISWVKDYLQGTKSVSSQLKFASTPAM